MYGFIAPMIQSKVIAWAVAVLIALCALLGAGWYIHSLKSSNAELRAAVAVLKASQEQLKAQVKSERALAEYARTAGKVAADKARATLKELEKAYANDKAASEWGSVRIPDSIADRL